MTETLRQLADAAAMQQLKQEPVRILDVSRDEHILRVQFLTAEAGPDCPAPCHFQAETIEFDCITALNAEFERQEILSLPPRFPA